jgi:murein DD-endopeptidase MepM/ murein hydrolase activator NlpD
VATLSVPVASGASPSSAAIPLGPRLVIGGGVLSEPTAPLAAPDTATGSMLPAAFSRVALDGPDVAVATPSPKPTPKPKPKPKPKATSRPAVRFLWPVPGGVLSQRFGCTGVPVEPPFGNCRHYHNGIDIAAPLGTRIVAAAAGTVVLAGWVNNGGGYQVWISVGNGLYTGYHHMASVAVRVGQSVRRGQMIGRVGMTGNATGPHCHFMVTRGRYWTGTGTALDPLRYV